MVQFSVKKKNFKQNFKEMFSILIDFNSDVVITNDTREPE